MMFLVVVFMVKVVVAVVLVALVVVVVLVCDDLGVGTARSREEPGGLPGEALRSWEVPSAGPGMGCVGTCFTHIQYRNPFGGLFSPSFNTEFPLGGGQTTTAAPTNNGK